MPQMMLIALNNNHPRALTPTPYGDVSLSGWILS